MWVTCSNGVTDLWTNGVLVDGWHSSNTPLGAVNSVPLYDEHHYWFLSSGATINVTATSPITTFNFNSNGATINQTQMHCDNVSYLMCWPSINGDRRERVCCL